MKNRYQSILALLIAGGITLAARLNAEPPDPPPQPGQAAMDPSGKVSPGHVSPSAEAPDPAQSSAAGPALSRAQFLGREVRNGAGKRLGMVEDVMVGLDADHPGFAIVKYGGVLGIGGTRVAVPLTDLTWTETAQRYVLGPNTRLAVPLPDLKWPHGTPGGAFILDASKTQFRAASARPTDPWMALAGRDWARNVNRFYGEPANAGPSPSVLVGAADGEGARQYIRDIDEPKSESERENPATTGDPGAERPPATASRPELSGKVDEFIGMFAGTASGVRATIADGVVTLKGRVTIPKEKRELVAHIKALTGVTKVIDDELLVTTE